MAAAGLAGKRVCDVTGAYPFVHGKFYIVWVESSGETCYHTAYRARPYVLEALAFQANGRCPGARFWGKISEVPAPSAGARQRTGGDTNGSNACMQANGMKSVLSPALCGSGRTETAKRFAQQTVPSVYKRQHGFSGHLGQLAALSSLPGDSPTASSALPATKSAPEKLLRTCRQDKTGAGKEEDEGGLAPTEDDDAASADFSRWQAYCLLYTEGIKAFDPVKRVRFL